MSAATAWYRRQIRVGRFSAPRSRRLLAFAESESRALSWWDALGPADQAPQRNPSWSLPLHFTSMGETWIQRNVESGWRVKGATPTGRSTQWTVAPFVGSVTALGSGPSPRLCAAQAAPAVQFPGSGPADGDWACGRPAQRAWAEANWHSGLAQCVRPRLFTYWQIGLLTNSPRNSVMSPERNKRKKKKKEKSPRQL
ncbi:hypothetical protein VTG60DRAFT_5434 [Thermothelomyces hinnuleus]